MREHKIGAPYRTALQFAPDEEIPENLQGLVVGAIRQGKLSVPAAVGALDPETRMLPIVVPTDAFSIGRAEFDVWIGNEPIPGRNNIEILFIKGAAR